MTTLRYLKGDAIAYFTETKGRSREEIEADLQKWSVAT
jgi:hypothetical protein